MEWMELDFKRANVTECGREDALAFVQNLLTTNPSTIEEHPSRWLAYPDPNGGWPCDPVEEVLQHLESGPMCHP